MTSVHTQARDRLLGAYRNVTVAGAAGISAGVWLSRVLSGDRNGYIGPLHRGRLPAVEIFQDGTEDWRQLSLDQGGMGVVTTRWKVRVHVTGADQAVAEELARAILYAGLIVTRALNYFFIGNDAVDKFISTPLGYAMEVTLTVENAMSRTDYETGGPAVTFLPGGGMEIAVNFNDISPITVVDVPLGAVVDNVEVNVSTGFDAVGAVLSIGNDSDSAAYMATTENHLAAVGTIWDKDADDDGPVTVKVFFTPGTGGTQGHATVRVSLVLAS